MLIKTQLERLKAAGYKPGQKINRSGAVSRWVASIGNIGDWAVYKAPCSWGFETIAKWGDKVSKEEAVEIFPELDALGLYYRP